MVVNGRLNLTPYRWRMLQLAELVFEWTNLRKLKHAPLGLGKAAV